MAYSHHGTVQQAELRESDIRALTTLYQAETGLRYETDDSTIPSFALSLDGTFIDADSGQTTLSVEIERIGRQDLESSVIIQLGPYNISTHESSDETLPRIEDPICRFLTDQSSVFVDILLPTGIVQELTLQLAAPVNGEISNSPSLQLNIHELELALESEHLVNNHVLDGEMQPLITVKARRLFLTQSTQRLTQNGVMQSKNSSRKLIISSILILPKSHHQALYLSCNSVTLQPMKSTQTFSRQRSHWETTAFICNRNSKSRPDLSSWNQRLWRPKGLPS